jgi:hypothetical protein
VTNKLLALAFLALVFAPSKVLAETAVANASSTVVANNGEVVVVNRVVAKTELTEEQRTQMRLEKQAQIEGYKAELKKKKQEMMEQYKDKLSLIKDEKKKQKVEKIRTQMCTINQNRTNTMMGQLNRMLDILVKVETKMGVAKASGKDVSSVVTALAAARTKIDEAKAAVSAQAGAECVLNISGSSSTLSGEVGKAISGLEQTLKSVNEKVKGAKDSVSEAIKVLAKVMGTPLPTTKSN